MGAFQTGFTLGSRIAADALDRKDREEQRKREDEDRKLRNELTRSQINAAREEASKRAQIAEITRGIVDTTQGIDRAATNAALNQDFDAALAASDAAVMSENASRQGQRPAAASAGSWMPLSVNPNAPPPRRLPDGQIDLGVQPAQAPAVAQPAAVAPVTAQPAVGPAAGVMPPVRGGSGTP